MKSTSVSCVGLVRSNGFTFISVCRFYLEKQETVFFYYKKHQGRKVECEIGYDPRLYTKKAKLHNKPGTWKVKRQSFDTISANGQRVEWFDNDRSMIVRVSKYGKKLFNNLQ